MATVGVSAPGIDRKQGDRSPIRAENAGRPAPWRLIFHCPHVFSPQTTMVAVHLELDF